MSELHYTTGMTDQDGREYRAAVVDRLRLIIARRAVWPDERGDVLAAARALGVDPADPEVGHPLAGVYRALRQAAAGHGVLYLNHEHCQLLNDAIAELEKGEQ
jgi:hypothetical protein